MNMVCVNLVLAQSVEYLKFENVKYANKGPMRQTIRVKRKTDSGLVEFDEEDDEEENTMRMKARERKKLREEKQREEEKKKEEEEEEEMEMEMSLDMDETATQFDIEDEDDFSELKWRDLTDMSKERQSPSLCVVNHGKGNETIVVMAGYNNDDEYLRHCEVLKYQSEEWCTIAELHRERKSATAINVDDVRVLIAGGTNKFADVSRSVEEYHFAKDTWMVLPKMLHKHSSRPLVYAHPRNPHLVFVCGNELSNRYGAGLGQMEMYDRRTNKWLDLGEMKVMLNIDDDKRVEADIYGVQFR